VQGQGQRWTSVLLTPAWIAVHVGLVLAVATFGVLAWWQIGRAADGNLLSYGYAFEWPAFAAFTIWVWSVEVRKALRAARAQTVPTPQAEPADQSAPAPRRRRRNETAYDDSDDPELAAYNHYLAWFNANPHLTPADYPGLPAKENSP
jgi:hypothetical protein